MAKVIYLIGSLRNPEVPKLGNILRQSGHEVFDDWFGAGPEADDYWKAHETQRGTDYYSALHGYAAENVFSFDKRHLDRCTHVVLVMPAGKSGHLELGYAIGAGKVGYVAFDQEPERWDVMYRFAIHSGGDVCFSYDKLVESLNAVH